MLKLLLSLLAAKTGPAVKPAVPTSENEGRKKRRRSENEFTSYYGRPVIKKPHWIWPIWVYFWVGGIAGGASAIATLAELFGDDDKDRSIVRAGRYISLAGMLVSPVLLIIDLERPSRFHHMLRVLKLRSPLSVGTYILSSTGLLSGLNAARQIVEDNIIPKNSLPGKLVLSLSNDFTQGLQGVDGMALGTYTGVLLSATAVPLWAETDTVLPPLFLSSAISTGAAAITLSRLVAGVDTEELHRLDRIEQASLFSELVLSIYGFTKLSPEVKKLAFEGINGPVLLGAFGLGQVGPFLLQLFGPKHGGAGRFFSLVGTLMALTGGFLLRTGVVISGKNTAGSAQAYHETTGGEGRASAQEQEAMYSKIKK